MMGAWEKSLDEVLLKFGVTKEKLQEKSGLFHWKGLRDRA